MKGTQDDNIKNVIEVNVPTGITMDEFDKSVINSAAKFSDNTGLIQDSKTSFGARQSLIHE